MARQSKAQRDTMERVMHEYKRGELKRRGGRRVKSRRQAVAIGLRESGSSKYQSRSQNKRALRKTKSKERHGETAMQEREGRGSMRRVKRKVARRYPGSRSRSASARRGRAHAGAHKATRRHSSRRARR
ncbi:MAG TPA: DUF6496 domain-containing protein [Pseudolabrys sp.]|nr:DUF6496 domain-containing protein [Pseudolabrys sp.]